MTDNEYFDENGNWLGGEKKQEAELLKEGAGTLEWEGSEVDNGDGAEPKAITHG
jgi:hypothetical protein